MKRKWVVAGCAWLLVAGLPLAAAVAQPPAPTSVATGGRLYDKWWKEGAGMKAPPGDHPLWAGQTTNKRKGETTWRCKECHGWDYRGKDGAYGSGSRYTGFAGVMAVQTKSTEEILKALASPNHGFASVLNAATLTHLANFLKHGLVDLAQVIDLKTKKPVKADEVRGKQLSDVCAACHGADGKTLNFGPPDKPEYVGTVAKENPWEFVHKVRFGQPGSDPAMPAGVELGLTLQDVLDILAYSQTLPGK